MGDRILTPFAVDAFEAALQRAVRIIQDGINPPSVTIPIVSGETGVYMRMIVSRFSCGEKDCDRCNKPIPEAER